jgi:hypothetical protein
MSTATAKEMRFRKPNLSDAGASLQESVSKELLWARRAAKMRSFFQVHVVPAKQRSHKAAAKKKLKKKK